MAGKNGSKSTKKASNVDRKFSSKRSVSSSSYYALISRLLAILVGILAVQLPWGDLGKWMGAKSASSTSDDNSKSSSKRKAKSQPLHNCKIYMAKSNIPQSGWGIFAKETIPRNEPVLPPELVLQVPDITTTEAPGFQRILKDYMWSAAVTGGQFEGHSATFSVMPGLGMLANGHLTQFDVVPDQARRHVVTPTLERYNSPLAGAVTQYHSMQYYAFADIPAGSEIFVNYGTDWQSKISNEAPPKLVESQDTFEEDFCLDRLRPGITHEHGYGAVLTHAANAGTVLLPLPVLPIHKSSVKDRLLLNYCYGHEDSDLVLYPYSPMSNYINHDGILPNARLQWRNATELPSLESMLNDQPKGLLLELVATRRIESGEQVTIDYGRAWEAAWVKHVEAWNAKRTSGEEADDTTDTAVSYVYPNDPLLTVRTEAEQRKSPYASNLQTVCYRYDNEGAVPHRLHKSRLEACRVLQRTTKDDYLVEFSSDAVQTRIPTKLITFTDKPGTSDQALKDAFRQVIGMEDIFPNQWLRSQQP